MTSFEKMLHIHCGLIQSLFCAKKDSFSAWLCACVCVRERERDGLSVSGCECLCVRWRESTLVCGKRHVWNRPSYFGDRFWRRSKGVFDLELQFCVYAFLSNHQLFKTNLFQVQKCNFKFVPLLLFTTRKRWFYLFPNLSCCWKKIGLL